MENTRKTGTILVVGEEIVSNETKKKQQKYSVSYGLKAVRSHIDNLKEEKVLDEKSYNEVSKIFEEATKKWIKEQYGF